MNEQNLPIYCINSRGKVTISNASLLKFLGEESYVQLKRTFTKTIKLKFDKYKTIKLVESLKTPNGLILLFPRFLAFKYLEKGLLPPIQNNIIIKPVHFIKIPTFNCRPYPVQRTIVSHLVKEYFNEAKMKAGLAGVICEVEAGLGKTFIGAMIINELKVKTLYVVPNEYLLKQTKKELIKCFPDLKIGSYYGVEKTDGDIVLMIINSTTLSNYIDFNNTNGVKKIKSINKTPTISPFEYFKQFGLSIWDEVQDYASTERSKGFCNASTPYMLGLTAEANHREDKCDIICHYNVGPVCIAEKIPGYDVPIADRYNAKVAIIKYNGPPKYTANLLNDSTGMMQCSKMTRQIIQDPYRTQLLLHYAKKLYDEGHNFFIWCDMREAIHIISDLLKSINLDCITPELNEDDGISDMFQMLKIDGDNKKSKDDKIDKDENPNDNNKVGDRTALLMGGVTESEIEKAQTARIIIATYQFLYKGVSLPKFDAMIFYTPRRSKIYQTLKRIFRMGGDTLITRHIIDIVDNKTKLKSQLIDRKKQYNSPVFNMKISEKIYNWDGDNIQYINPLNLEKIIQSYMIEEHWIKEV